MPESIPVSPARPLRICHVITRMIIGGAQENTLLSVRGQVEHGHHVSLLTGPSEGPEGKLLEKMQVPGARIVEIPSLCRNLNPLADWRAYCELRNHFRQTPYDVVHTHSSKAGVLARFAAWKELRDSGCRICHTVHGQPFHPYQSGWRNRLYIAAERAAAKRCHHIFAVAQAMIDQCVAAGVAPASHYSVVYSGMDLDAFINARREPQLRAELGIPPAAPVVGTVARLFELKGYDLLLQAAPAIVAAHPEVRFLIVGDGVLRPQLECDIATLGLTKNFVFAGLVPPTAVPRYVAQMDMLAHLSLREGLPRTVVQALAGGIPAVAFALDGTPEVVLNGQTGYLCAPGDVTAVSTAIRALLDDPAQAQALGRQGQERVRRQFDWRLMVERLDAAYRKS